MVPLYFYNSWTYLSHYSVFPVGSSSKQLPSVNVTSPKSESTLDNLTKTRSYLFFLDNDDLNAGTGVTWMNLEVLHLIRGFPGWPRECHRGYCQIKMILSLKSQNYSINRKHEKTNWLIIQFRINKVLLINELLK